MTRGGPAAEVYYQPDVDLSRIRQRRIAVVGYGNQGRAQALNLRDSGCDVRIGARASGKSWARAEGDGFPVASVAESVAWADLVSILLPDQLHGQLFTSSIAPHLGPGTLLIFAHGFSVQFEQVRPPRDVDVGLVAPVGPGDTLRRLYLEGSGIPSVVAVDQDVTGAAFQLCLAYAGALGCARAGVIRTTFAEETETDLFGEQAVLCGGLSELITAGFDTLVAAGYQEDVAYFECVHQVKLIVDLIYEHGIAGMRQRISETAEFGDYLAGRRVIDEGVRAAMRDVLDDIKTGTFARRWVSEYDQGMPHLQARREADSTSPMERVGRKLRAMMPWLPNEEGAVGAVPR